MVKAMITPQVADLVRQLHPLRLSYEMFTQANPLMAPLAKAAQRVREHRKPLAADNPLLGLQEAVSNQIVHSLDAFRDARDAMAEKLFLGIYGNPALQAAVGVKPESVRERRAPKSVLHRELLAKRIEELKSQIDKGGLQECTIRALIYAGSPRGKVDERAVQTLRQVRLADDTHRLTLAQFKAMAREQFFLMLLDPDAALAAIPRLLPPGTEERQEALTAVRQVLSATGDITGEVAERLKRVTALFETSAAALPPPSAVNLPFVANVEIAKAS
jgi:hypothetical protein